MPSSTTHSYFARDVLNKIKPNIKEKINKEINTYITFSNGPDNFFTYKKTRSFGHTMHRQKTGDYFKNVIEYIKQNNLQDNSYALGYLYGLITHYCLDSTIHPLVYYQTGRYIKGNKKRKKYRGKHALMELVIDEYMIKARYKGKINKFKIHDFSTPKITIDETITQLIQTCTKNTYDKNITKEEIYKSIRNQRLTNKYIRYDRFGIKKIIYNILSCITLNKIPELKIASYKFNYKKYLYYLNLDKNEWFHPVDKKEKYNYSYIELYLKALKNATELINKIDDVLNNKEDIDNIFDELNKSYLTGKSIDDTRKIKYFSY